MIKPKEKKTTFYYCAFFALIFIGCCFYFYQDIIHLFPTFIHAWTQSDRLAIAMNFQENGFDFFHPATYNLMTKHGITQVDFPIHDYLVACISALFGTELIATFRLYNVVYSLIGLFFIYRLAYLLSGSKIKSFFIAFFVFTLPFYVYYQAGFLPSTPSFANLFIGLFLLFSYQESAKIRYFYWGIFFICLAALARMPFAIFLIAAALHYSIKWIRKRKMLFKEVLAFALAFLAVLAYYLYNQQLSSKFGSMFLQHLLPITSFSHFMYVLSTFLHRWSANLLGISHMVFILLLLLLGIYSIHKKAFITQLQSKLCLYFLISTLGVLLFFLLMGVQYIDHDYYLIDTFLPLLVMILIICATSIIIPQKMELLVLLFFSALSIAFVLEAKKMQDERYEIPYNDRINFAYNKYSSSAAHLKDWEIDKQDTVIFIGTYSTNIPLAAWERKGYTVMNTSEDSIRKYLKNPFQYAVILDSFRVVDILWNYPDIMYELDRKFENDGLAVYVPSQNKDKVGFFNNFIEYRKTDFESSLNTGVFSGNTKIDYPNDTSSLSLEILPIHEYSFTYKKKVNQLKSTEDLHVVVKADYLNKIDSSGINLVCQFGDDYQSRYFASELKETSVWQEHQSHFVFPAGKIKNGETLLLYYWNQGKSELYVDNYSLLIFQ